MNATDRYKIALNIAAQLGLDHPQFITEYSKAVSFTHTMDTMDQMSQLAPSVPPNLPPQQQSMPQGGQNEALGQASPAETVNTTTPPTGAPTTV
jgi:hypothetical protein